jgi:hypothetical protein
MDKNERDQQDPQSEGTGIQRNAERLRDGGGDVIDPKNAAREASEGDEKSS